MTLSSRNNLLKVGIVVGIAALVMISVLAFRMLPLYPDLTAMAIKRAPGLIQLLTGRFFKPVPAVSFVTMVAAVAYAFITLSVIYYFFEKTLAAEILFLALFVFSFIFEGIRVTAPLWMLYELPGIYITLSFRVLFFARFFGIFSLFTASLYASGMEMRRQENFVLIGVAAAFVFALGIPIDGLSWDSSLNMVSGYSTMLKLVEIGVILITMASFFIAAYSRGSREYLIIGGGSFLAVLGRNMLFSSDTWLTPLPALALLVTGTWFMCAQIRKVYLWL
ncbi:MAG: hypothetical protein LBG76_02925 [Treponema sp.]|jgi:hypothetical protein|nr:hypothetical protein [Treponema sp.]